MPTSVKGVMCQTRQTRRASYSATQVPGMSFGSRFPVRVGVGMGMGVGVGVGRAWCHLLWLQK